MKAWIYIKVKDNEMVALGPIYSIREVIDKMLADDGYENGNIHEAGSRWLEITKAARTLEGHQFNGFRGYIRTINV